MISTRSKEKLAGSHVAKDTQQYLSKPTEFGLSGYQELEMLATKLVGSLKR